MATGLPQRSPISSVLFAIYIAEIRSAARWLGLWLGSPLTLVENQQDVLAGSNRQRP